LEAPHKNLPRGPFYKLEVTLKEDSGLMKGRGWVLHGAHSYHAEIAFDLEVA